MWAAWTCEARSSGQATRHIRLKCSFLWCAPPPSSMCFEHTDTHTHAAHIWFAQLFLKRRVMEEWIPLKGKPFLSKSVSIRITPLPRVSFWIYRAGLRPQFFHLNIIQENMILKMSSSPSSTSIASISHTCWIELSSFSPLPHPLCLSVLIIS